MKKFISFLVYHPDLYKMNRDFHYHFAPCYALLEKGYEVEIVSLGDSVIIENDPQYDSRISVKYMNHLFSILYYFWKQRNDSLIYANSFILPSLLMGIVGKHTVFFSHDPVLPSTYGRFWFFKRIFVYLCYLFFTKIRVINTVEKSILDRYGLGKKALVLPLAIDTNRDYKKRSHFGNILLLGRISEKKNPLIILGALQKVILQFPHIQIYQVGNSTDYSYTGKTYENLVTEYGLKNNIRIMGFMNLSDVANLPTSLYVNSSYSEGQCLALYDAVMMGHAICASNISSFQGIFGDRILLHTPDDANMLADNILKYLNNPELQDIHTAENFVFVKKNYSFSHNQELIQNAFIPLL